MGDDRSSVYEENGRIVYRASQLGSCTKMLAALRLGYRETATPAKVQGYFDRGNAHEDICLLAMEAEGWKLYDKQSTVELDVGAYLVRGHLDAMGYHTDFSAGLPFVVEAKAPGAWQRMLDDIYSDKPDSFLTHKYKWQISAYMIQQKAQALLVCLDDYELRYHGIEEPFYTLSDFVERIVEIESQAKVGIPQFCDIRSFPCPVFYLHEDEAPDGDDPFDSQIDSAVVEMKRHELKAKELRGRVIELLGDRKGYKANGVKVSRFPRNSSKYDYTRMKQDGVDVDSYKTTTKSENIRIDYQEDKGDE